MELILEVLWSQIETSIWDSGIAITIGRPDLVDDFPDDPLYWLDTDGDGIADVDPNELDIDGDGVTDTLDSNIPGWDLDSIYVLDTDIMRKPEPLNVQK